MGARKAGAHLACQPGCTECCIGPFPIDALDARRLARGLAELARTDSRKADAIAERAQSAVATLQAGFPGDSRTGFLEDDEGPVEEFLERHAKLPCPALDPATGSCSLYAFRPIPCRTFGLPVRIGVEDLPPCRLCFRCAPAGEVDGCRVTIDPDEITEAALACLEAPASRGETLVAFALAARNEVTEAAEPGAAGQPMGRRPGGHPSGMVPL